MIIKRTVVGTLSNSLVQVANISVGRYATESITMAWWIEISVSRSSIIDCSTFLSALTKIKFTQYGTKTPDIYGSGLSDLGNVLSALDRMRKVEGILMDDNILGLLVAEVL